MLVADLFSRRAQVTLLKDAPNPVGILRSKATGEPPYSLANSAFFAVKNALMAAFVNSRTVRLPP